MNTLEDNQDLAEELLDEFSPRNEMFEKMDKLFNYDWEMPEGMPDWILKVTSTDPRDAVMTTVRTFATVKPRFKITPMLNNEINRNRANQIETAIDYNIKRSGRRTDSSLTWDVMMSASLYAMVATQVIYLPYQEKILDAMGKDTRRIKAARRHGDFAFIVHNPANVYPQYSEYGLEGVLTVRVQEWNDFVFSWGKLALGFDKSQLDTEGNLNYVTVYDYTNYDERCVWGTLGETEDIVLEGPGVTVLHEPNKLGFLPYTVTRWGNSLSADSSKNVMPLLQSVEGSGQWNMLNVFDSLDASLAIKRAAAVRFAGEFPPGQEPEVDNTQPDGVLNLPMGTRNFQPLPGNSVDQRISTEKLDFKSRIWQSTVARALQTLEFPSGTAYSSVNQILSTAANSLASYKMLGERTLAEVAYQMLCWISYYGKEYGTVDLYGRYEDKSNMGKEVRISSDTIDPNLIEIEAILTADMPVDKLQQINGAVLVKNNFAVPEAELLEDLGYTNPEELEKRRRLEDYKNAYLQTDIQKLQMKLQLEMQQAQMAMQMQAQQAQQEQAQAQQQQAMAQQQAGEQQAMAQQQAQAGGAGGNVQTENLGGQGFNPAAGGVPPVQGAPGQGEMPQ